MLLEKTNKLEKIIRKKGIKKAPLVTSPQCFSRAFTETAPTLNSNDTNYKIKGDYSLCNH